MRYLYNALFFLAIPLILLRLLWRSRKAPAYAQRWQERLGFYQTEPQSCDLWIHAVSVGEAEAVFPLIKLLQQLKPDIKLLITTTTPTGSARVQSILTHNISHVYLPYDVPIIVKRFLKHFKPKIAVIVETEIWLNLFKQCHQNTIPLYLINARLSEKSTRGYQKIPSLIKPALATISTIFTQSRLDAERFIQIGTIPDKVIHLGNIKFDISISQDLLNQARLIKDTQFAQRFVWLLASTHDNEEAQLLSLYPCLKKEIPELLIIIAPRHPERFNTIIKLAEQHAYKLITKSSNQLCQSDTDIYLLDSIGELKLFYATADISFVGGSLVDIGGHNILEPAAIGTPIVFGQYMRNFKAIAEAILNQQAAVQCFDLKAIEQSVLNLYHNETSRKTLANNAKAFITQHQGVINKLADIFIMELNNRRSGFA
ncbi:MAG: lipid IV(A) 3-deoxy-D-manno-octulosonic acid transferase [Methylococcaceae bacterium]